MAVTGSVRINTRLDNSQLMKDCRALKAVVNETANAVKRAFHGREIQALEQQMEATRAAMAPIVQELTEIENRAASAGKSSARDFQKAQAEASKLQQQYDALLNKIYETMRGVTYTPLQVSIPLAADAPAPGEIITVTDAYGRTMQAYIMQRTISGQKVTLESTGNARRDSTAALNSQKWKNLQGKVLEIQTSVDGLKITAADLAGGLTVLELTVDGLRTEVSGKLDGEDAQVLIDQSLRGISLSASTAGTTSTLTIKAGDVTLSSAQINFIGMVTISDLSTSGKTIINGDNVTTGALGSVGGNTRYDLDAGTLRTGRDGSTRVEINDSGIRWYYQNYLTGVLYSQYGKTYIGDNSRDTFLGWFSSGTPNFEFTNGGKTNTFVGIAIRQDGLIHCNADKFEIPGRIECASLAVNGREI